MTTKMTRRDFAAAALALPGSFASRVQAAGKAEITVGITLDTRPDWYAHDSFMRSLDEVSEVGYHWVETFWPYISQWENSVQELKDVLSKRHLQLETVSNSPRFNSGMRINFWDPALRAGTIEDHMRVVRFLHGFRSDHFKINCGDPVPKTPTIYTNMSAGFNELGKRISDLGIKFGVHAHTGSIFETQQDVDAIMEQTDPKHVYFILDTGHVTMAGMDPVALTRTYVSRIIEFHMKDVAPEHKGGYKGPRRTVSGDGQDQRGGRATQPGVNPYIGRRQFFELGKGGVDFPAIKKILDDNRWKGWMTVELDSTETTAKESCAVSKKYLEMVLGLKV